MTRNILLIAFILVSFLYPVAFSKGKGINADPNSLEYVCALSGGEWFGVEGGYWSCCWGNWGCVQCDPNNKCEVLCETQACRDANNQNRVQETTPKPGLKILHGLTPANMSPPVIPVKPRPMTVIPLKTIDKIKNN